MGTHLQNKSQLEGLYFWLDKLINDWDFTAIMAIWDNNIINHN